MRRVLITIVICLACQIGFAQVNNTGIAVPVITTKKVYLQHQEQKDSLFIPAVSAGFPALQQALSDTVLFSGDKLEDVVANYTECACGTTGLSYEVTFLNNKGISIRLLYDGVGAYSTSYQTWLTLNVTTGKPYKLSESISKAGLAFIAQRYKRILLYRIRQAKNETAGNAYRRLLRAAQGLTTNDITRKFLVTAKGIIVTTDDELPHVVQSMEPNRELFFSQAQLRPFVKAYSVEPGTHRLRIFNKP